MRDLTYTRILLKANEGEGGPAWGDEQIAEAFDVSLSTIGRVRRQAVAEGVEAALQRRPSSRVYTRKIDGNLEAHLSAVACTPAPAGRDRWTVRLLADTMAWAKQRNKSGATAEWRFTTADARIKLKRLYPSI